MTTTIALYKPVAYAYSNLHICSPLYQMKDNNWNNTLFIDTDCFLWFHNFRELERTAVFTTVTLNLHPKAFPTGIQALIE